MTYILYSWVIPMALPVLITAAVVIWYFKKQ